MHSVDLPTLLTLKLWHLKTKLLDWNANTFRNIHDEIVQATAALYEIQRTIAIEGDSDDRFIFKMNCTSRVNDLLDHKHSLLTQKHRLQWLKDDNRNLAFFHRLHSSNLSRASIKLVLFDDTLVDIEDEIGHYVV